MEKAFIIAVIVTFLFCVVKFVEMKYLDKEMKPLKVLVRDAIIVFTCALFGTFGYYHIDTYIYDFLDVVTETKTLDTKGATTQIFTDEPGF
jgi:hypothetical protein